jgi:hypothetical protein
MWRDKLSGLEIGGKKYTRLGGPDKNSGLYPNSPVKPLRV